MIRGKYKQVKGVELSNSGLSRIDKKGLYITRVKDRM